MTKQGKVILILAIVGGCCVAGVMILLVLAAITIPAIQSVIRKGNEASAISVLKVINTEEQAYNATYPERGYTCSLQNLGGSAQTGPATADAAQLLPPELATGHKAGYTFAFTDCVKEKDQMISYKITAVPDEPRHTGTRGFCTDQDGAIKADRNGGANCTETLQ